MSVILAFIILSISIVALVVSSNVTVDNASKMARKLGVTEAVIGFIMLAFATSIPELAVTVASSAEKQVELAIGNIIGSNIANVGLIIGLPILILGFRSSSAKVNLQGISRVDITSLYAGLLASTAIPLIIAIWIYSSQPVGISLIAMYILISFLLYRDIVKSKTEKPPTDHTLRIRMIVIVTLTSVGIAGVIVSAQLVVNSAVNIASFFGIPEAIIGATIIAVGTSLPELAVSTQALSKGKSGMAFGNAIGSCLVNITLILGLALIITPMKGIFPSYITLTLFTILLNLLLLYSIASKKITHISGAVLFSIFVIFITITYGVIL